MMHEVRQPEAAMFLRLVTNKRDAGSHQSQGVFMFAYALLKDGDLSPEEAGRLKAILVRFEENLPLPDRSRLDARAIFWFKEHLGEFARRVWELAEFVTVQGLPTEIVRTTRPGYIVFEDDFQVAAVPFRDTYRARKKRSGSRMTRT